MVDFEITKQRKVLEINNDMCHNYYFLIYGRIYNENKTKYRKFKYIEWFDIFDVQDFFDDKEYITKNDIIDYLNSIENGYLTSIKNYEDTKHLQEFYNYCNETITNYNKIAKYY